MHFVDSDHPDVIAFAKEATAGATTDRERAVALFYAVRDRIRYDPYSMCDDPETYKASSVVRSGVSYCIPKSVLLAAAARAVGIPARLGFADVKNHLSSEKLRERMGSDLFIWHGYTELFVEAQRWPPREVKVTSAFNIELCDRFGVLPQEFDGEHDALLHPFTADGREHMEYVRDRGSFEDVPFDEIIAEFRSAYPGMFGTSPTVDAAFRPS